MSDKKKKEFVKVGKCALCNETKELQNSHIYPRFLIKLCRDKEFNNKFIFMSNSNDIKIPPQDGPKEYLLCKSCESKFHKHENYYAKFFNRKLDNIYRIKDNLVMMKDFDYSSIRLFLLSILWRLSVTSKLNFKINLSDENREILRTSLFLDNPLEPEEYSFDTFLLHFDGKSTKGFIVNPRESKESVDIIISGILYRICKTRIDNNEIIKNPLENEKWFAKLTNIRSIEWLMSVIEHIDKI